MRSFVTLDNTVSEEKEHEFQGGTEKLRDDVEALRVKVTKLQTELFETQEMFKREHNKQLPLHEYKEWEAKVEMARKMTSSLKMKRSKAHQTQLDKNTQPSEDLNAVPLNETREGEST